MIFIFPSEELYQFSLLCFHQYGKGSSCLCGVQTQKSCQKPTEVQKGEVKNRQDCSVLISLLKSSCQQKCAPFWSPAPNICDSHGLCYCFLILLKHHPWAPVHRNSPLPEVQRGPCFHKDPEWFLRASVENPTCSGLGTCCRRTDLNQLVEDSNRNRKEKKESTNKLTNKSQQKNPKNITFLHIFPGWPWEFFVDSESL